jgi:SAM-dependent methyltransferase
MDVEVDVRKAVWSRYWSHGVAHSCGGSYGNSYEGALAQFWRTAFAGLRPGARVLDIATGNGALPQLLLASAGGALSCDAIDLAQVEPQWVASLTPAQRAQCRFHPNQPAEALPFPDGHFDMVVSQYGLEYTDLDRSVAELLRVLAAGGKVCIVAHHAAARPVRLAVAELEHLSWLHRDQGLLDVAQAMIEPMARAGTEAGRAALSTDQAANALRSRFNALQGEAGARANGSECPDVLFEVREAIVALLNLALGSGRDAAEQAIARLRGELADSEVRLRELRDHALDETGAQRLCESLCRAGGSYSLQPILDRSYLMGWSIVVERT